MKALMYQQRSSTAAAQLQLGLAPADAAETLLVAGSSVVADEKMTTYTSNLEEKAGRLDRALPKEQGTRQQREAAINEWIDLVQSELIAAGQRAEGIQQQISKSSSACDMLRGEKAFMR